MSERPPDDLDALCLRTTDREAILHALGQTCAAEGLVRAPAQRLRGYGHFHNGEEDPSLRRFLVGPPEGGWTVVLLSAQDWDHAWIPQLLAHLRVRAAYLMLHDGDTCTLHAYDGPDLLAELVTSPAHFDRPAAPPHPRLREALEALAGRPVGEEKVQACCFPPGRIDVDGRLAHERLRALLGLPASAAGTYGLAMEADGRTPSDAFAGWIQACWQDADDARADEAFEREMAERAAATAPGGDGEAEGSGNGTLLQFRRRDPE